jgi:hypothetical protein
MALFETTTEVLLGLGETFADYGERDGVARHPS